MNRTIRNILIFFGIIKRAKIKSSDLVDPETWKDLKIDLHQTGDYYNSLKGVTTGINRAGEEVITGVVRSNKE